MRVKLGSGLIPLNLLVLLLVVVVMLFPSSGLRIWLGVPFILFLPGYALIMCLFPRRDRLGNIERVALSFGMSIVCVPLIGLILNYTPWGIRPEPVMYSVAAFTLAVSLIGWWRLWRMDKEDRFSIDFALKMPGWSGGRWDKALTVALAVMIVVAAGVLVYAVVTPNVGERFTEFYILGEGGMAESYPSELTAGEEATVILGIVNREQANTSYRVEVWLEGEKIGDVGPVALEHDQEWEQEVSFAPSASGEDQKVEFLLYKDGAAEPAGESLHLWIDVTD